MLPAPTFANALTSWTVQPLAIVLAAGLAVWYARAVRRRTRPWRTGHTVLFAVGLLALVWTTCGFAGKYLDALFMVWVSQQLALLLVVPYLILAGQPLQLTGPRVQRLLDSRFVRTIGNPLIGPALVPLLSVVLFFGPLPRWSVDHAAVGWIEQLVLVAIGGLIVLPLIGVGGPRTSLAVGASLAIGAFELVLDAVPGIVLRLHRTVSTSYFDVRAVTGWAPSPVRDQQLSGAVLWCVAELLDLPFLVLVFRQWIRADARDAADIDAVLEAERIARGQARDALDEHEDRDQPWWLSDPDMQKRLNRPR